MGAFDFIKSIFGSKEKEAPKAIEPEIVEKTAEEAPVKQEAEETPSLSQPISVGGGYGTPFAEAPKAEMVETKAETGQPKSEVEQESYLGVDVEKSPSQEVTLQRGEKFLQDVFAAMGIEVQILRREDEEGTVYELVGDRLGILIGKHGQTLDAIQYLANLAANKDHADGHARIIIDIEGYRSRREETLMRLAGHLAEKACRIGQEVHLEPMNRHERKIIHTALQDNRKVSTYSAGEEPRRYVVIVPRRRKRRYEKEY